MIVMWHVAVESSSHTVLHSAENINKVVTRQFGANVCCIRRTSDWNIRLGLMEDK